MIDSTYDALAWGSHLPAILACIADTVGPVLEIGVGHFSTPALHAVCVQSDRKLYSVEKDDLWFGDFARKYSGQNHIFSDSTENLKGCREWAVVLIDDSPGGQNRANHFKDFIDRSVFVVVHDFHMDNEQAIAPLLGHYAHHVTTTYQPPTLVASSKRLVPHSILCL